MSIVCGKPPAPETRFNAEVERNTPSDEANSGHAAAFLGQVRNLVADVVVNAQLRRRFLMGSKP